MSTIYVVKGITTLPVGTIYVGGIILVAPRVKSSFLRNKAVVLVLRSNKSSSFSYSGNGCSGTSVESSVPWRKTRRSCWEREKSSVNLREEGKRTKFAR